MLNSQMKGLEQGQAEEKWDVSSLVFIQESARDKPHRMHNLPGLLFLLSVIYMTYCAHRLTKQEIHIKFSPPYWQVQDDLEWANLVSVNINTLL